MPSNKTDINGKVEHVFRHEYSKIVSYLTAKFGTAVIDQIEDAVQEALYKAMQVWSFNDIPKDSGKWLYRVAYNKMIDGLRRNSKSVEYSPDFTNEDNMTYIEESNGMFADEQLKMIFACCHPSMKESEQIMLSLKLLCGFSNKEISRTLFKEPEAVKKAITRAKIKFKTEIKELTLPPIEELAERLDTVLKIIYLIFTNGYTSFDGDIVLKKDVCEDALRLSLMLYDTEICNRAETRALTALMYYGFSRFDARIGTKGELLTLEDQDWSKWNRLHIAYGNKFLEDSAVESELSTYHLEAAIASQYSNAKSFETINWRHILNFYDVLTVLRSNPSVLLNKIVIIDKVKGAQDAYSAFKDLDANNYIKNYLYFSIKGDLQKKLAIDEYKESFKAAIELTENIKEKEFLNAKLLC